MFQNLLPQKDYSLMINQRILIFLDDERFFEQVKWINYKIKFDKIVIARNGLEFILALNEYMSDNTKEIYISFDHDINDYDTDGNEINGYTLIKFLVEKIMDGKFLKPRHIYYHSKNPIGVKNMQSYYENFVLNFYD